MRSPENRNSHAKKPGQSNSNEQSSHYQTPEAFTVLPPDDEMRQDPPMAPQPYRLTPSSRRHKNMSFAILAEPSSVPGSRSPSPTGRVSPFRGRGFNPAGSRHASPNPSPPPQEAFTTLDDPLRQSKIPRLSRRGSATVFGEKVTDYELSPNRRKLNAKLSQSLTDIAPRKVASRPPPSPRRPSGSSKPAFQRLSPIVGSSPEPSQSQSSPRNNTSSHPSKYTSPGRSRSFVNKPPKTTSKASRNVNREDSPSKNPTSPTRIPVKNYRNVQAKVNSFNRKPKVPPKPQVLNEESTEESSDNVTNRRKMPLRRDSVKSRTNSKSNVNSNSSTKNVNKDTNDNNINSKTNNNSASESKEKTNSDQNSIAKENDNDKNNPNIGNATAPTTQEEAKKSGSSLQLSDLLQPSTTAVVSSTTTTVTKPLKIEATIDPELALKSDNNKTMAPIVDGRILSATSVSHAMNRMNDTVLTSQTLMNESGLTKLSPAATAIIAMSNTDPRPENPALDTRNATTALPQVPEGISKTAERIAANNINSNHVTSTGLVPSARVLEQHVQNNMSKMLKSETKVANSISRSANDRIIEARTVIAHDVKPIKITVKEKPMDAEVQSGNVRFDTTNGLNERPSLPPPQHPNNDPQQPQEEPPKGNVCTRFLAACKRKMSCDRCKKPKGTAEEEVKDGDQTGCFSCRRHKPEREAEETAAKNKMGWYSSRRKKPDVTINVEDAEPPKKFWDRLKCCGKNKVADNGGCLPVRKRKDSWVEQRRDSILSEPPATHKSRCSKACCVGFLRKIFCCDKCKKKKPKLVEIPDSRRTSMMSKKKSLTPPVIEEQKPKLDASLVEHTSHMKAAIPVLPVSLAWFCLVMNCIAPGTGTIFSGMFCLCIGKPRFSQQDGYRPRIGAFIIDLIIGVGQCFTVLFCLVGWGWSIWWGVMMLKLAKKQKKIKTLEANAQEGATAVANRNRSSGDPERGS